MKIAKPYTHLCVQYSFNLSPSMQKIKDSWKSRSDFCLLTFAVAEKFNEISLIQSCSVLNSVLAEPQLNVNAPPQSTSPLCFPFFVHNVCVVVVVFVFGGNWSGGKLCVCIASRYPCIETSTSQNGCCEYLVKIVVTTCAMNVL